MPLVDWLEKGAHALNSGQGQLALRATIVLVIGWLLARLIRKRLPVGRLHPHYQLVLRRGLAYLVLMVAISWALRLLGVSLGVLLGAAGVLTVAIGFAAQTSASNLISGLFLMGERPFVVGDLIQVGETQGYVESIDLLSVRLRTFNHLLVRIPNETMLKSMVTNLTHFPIRRLDVPIGVAYKEDIKKVTELLLQLAARIPICMEEPPPKIIFLGYGESSVDLQFSLWSTTENHFELKGTIGLAVKQAFDQHGIEIPFPHRTLYAGSASNPFPVRLVSVSETANTPGRG